MRIPLEFENQYTRTQTILTMKSVAIQHSNTMAVKWLLLVAACVVVNARPQDVRDKDLPVEFFDEIKQLLAAKMLLEKENEIYKEQEREMLSSSPPRPKEVPDWPKEPLDVGQITAVSINSRGQPVIFHRADRRWDETSFNESHIYQHHKDGPIQKDTILVLDPTTGGVIYSWGSGLFYLPHGLTVDRHDNIWVTDVAMHQVFKYSPNHNYPKLTLGERFRDGYPRRGRVLLCMPTAVAVATTGEIFVADGYCNNQILKFNAAGNLLRVMPRPPEFLSLEVPHGLALLEQLDLVCVADRENMRVVCPQAGLHSSSMSEFSSPPATIQAPDLGRVFAVAALGDLVYAVNGPTSPMISIRGFTMDPRSETIIDHWEPSSAAFSNPHSIAISPNGSFMYITEIGPNKIWKFEMIIDN